MDIVPAVTALPAVPDFVDLGALEDFPSRPDGKKPLRNGWNSIWIWAKAWPCIWCGADVFPGGRGHLCGQPVDIRKSYDARYVLTRSVLRQIPL